MHNEWIEPKSVQLLKTILILKRYFLTKPKI